MAASAVGELAELPFDDPGSQVAGPPYCPVGARVRQPAADALLFGGQNAGLGLQLPVEDVAADDDEVGPAGCHAAGVADVEAVEAEEVAEVGDGLLQVAFLDEPVAAGRPIPGGSLPRHAGGLLLLSRFGSVTVKLHESGSAGQRNAGCGTWLARAADPVHRRRSIGWAILGSNQ
jgi:hypothetical protein